MLIFFFTFFFHTPPTQRIPTRPSGPRWRRDGCGGGGLGYAISWRIFALSGKYPFPPFIPPSSHSFYISFLTLLLSVFLDLGVRKGDFCPILLFLFPSCPSLSCTGENWHGAGVMVNRMGEKGEMNKKKIHSAVHLYPVHMKRNSKWSSRYTTTHIPFSLSETSSYKGNTQNL